MSKSLTGNLELDMVIGALGKQFGGKKMAHMGPLYETPKGITTGSTTLDVTLRIGGIPKARITELYGPESSGKTSLGLRIMANYRKQYPDDRRRQVLIDMERATTEALMISIGLDPSEVVVLYPDTAEEALESLVRLNSSGLVSVILLDSVDALQSENYLKKHIGDSDMQGIAKLMGQAMRQVAKHCVEKDVTNIIINQERASMDMYGPKSTTSGGNALKYYASLRLATMKQKESPNVPNAFLMRVKIIKSRVGPPQKEVEIDFLYAKGPDPHSDLVSCAKSLGLIRFAGSAVKLLGTNGEETPLCSGGKEGARLYLIQNPNRFEELRAACLNHSLTKEGAADEPEDDNEQVESEAPPTLND